MSSQTTNPATPTVGVLFCGAGGLSRGFEDAGYDCVFAVDADPRAAADHGIICEREATVADLGTMTPDELRALSPRRPDVLATSPPCKGFSGCLAGDLSRSAKYQKMNSLAQRGIWLALVAWGDDPPPLIVLENVPRISARGRQWMDQTVAMLQAYGYAVRETIHDCGEVGGLAQRRRRFLLVARLMSAVPNFLYQPPKQEVRGIGEVLGQLPTPLPHSGLGGPMHRLPRLSPLNWTRLALIRAGGDWRDLPAQVALHERTSRQNGGFGVEAWNRPSHAILADGSVRNTRASVADPRIKCSPRNTVYGVADWSRPANTVVAAACHDNGAYSVADPRSVCSRRDGSIGMTAWDQPSTTVISAGSMHNGPWQVADPRAVECTHYVEDAAIYGSPQLDMTCKRPGYTLIEAADGTWHRPMTTLELAALQGFPTHGRDGRWLRLSGSSHKNWRQSIGNAVPPPAARAIADTMLRTLVAAGGQQTFSFDGVWVNPRLYSPSLQLAAAGGLQ